MLEAVRATLLVSGFVFPGIAAYTAVYLVLGCMIIMLAQVRRTHLESPVARGIGLAILVVILSILLNGAEGEDWVALALVLPFVAALPTAAAFARTPVSLFAGVCLLGAISALILGLVDIVALGLDRAGGGNNPIHYASLAGMLGMASLAGALGQRKRIRFLFLIGPVAAFATALLSGSRGPLLADCVMFAIALVAFRADRRYLVALLAFPVAAVLVLIFSGEGQRALVLFTGVMSDATMSSDAQRIYMLQAAGQMLVSSPLWGYGFGDFMDVARAIQPIGERYENLHADISNLAAVAGALGLVAYFGLVGAPLLALVTRAARTDSTLVFLALIVSGGNAALGLTNAIIGVLPQTTLCVLMIGYVLARERALAGAPAAMIDPPDHGSDVQDRGAL